MVVFVKLAPCKCKVVLATSRRSRLHPSTTSQLVFICEDGVSFEYTTHTSSAAMKKCTSLGGVAVATGGGVKEGSCSMSWYFLVKWCAALPSEGVDEDLLFGLWSIYIEEVFAGFSPP
jgi:hypothetical protein